MTIPRFQILCNQGFLLLLIGRRNQGWESLIDEVMLKLSKEMNVHLLQERLEALWWGETVN